MGSVEDPLLIPSSGKSKKTVPSTTASTQGIRTEDRDKEAPTVGQVITYYTDGPKVARDVPYPSARLCLRDLQNHTPALPNS